MTFFRIFENILGYKTPPKKRRLPSSARPAAASRCRHVPSAQQYYDLTAKKRASVPHLGEGEAWKSPSRGRLAWPSAWRGIVNNCKSRPTREHCNQRIGCCSAVRRIALRTAALLYCSTGKVRGWMVGDGWVVEGGALAPGDGRVSPKNETPPVCFLFHTWYLAQKVLKNQPTNCSPRTRCTAVRTAAILVS